MEEVYPNIWREVIPLKGNPLRSINIFIVKTDEGNLIVDTGFNTPEIKAGHQAYIEALDLDLSQTKLFITHLHSDHTGLAHYFSQRGVEVIMNPEEEALVRDMASPEGKHWTSIVNNALKQGLEEDHLKLEEHPGFKFRPTHPFPITALKIGDQLTLGDFNFEVIDEAGHTPHMVGLYEADKKILFCGDHILGDITPNITYWGDHVGDSLGQYLENLDQVLDLEIDYLFSSHRSLIDDIDGRVEEILAHHQVRLDEARRILKEDGPSTVRHVTKGLQWDIRAKNWDDFPKSQKWFAAGEAQAHLEHLVALGEVKRQEKDGVFYFSLL